MKISKSKGKIVMTLILTKILIFHTLIMGDHIPIRYHYKESEKKLNIFYTFISIHTEPFETVKSRSLEK